ncbi:MAG: glutamate--tRNA ligase, partial [Roseiflexus sp.]|nr:glutamate--tRNA ligase [Roseiflexus sp.]
RAYLLQLTPLIHDRLKELGEAPELLEFFFREVTYSDPLLLIQKKMDAATTVAALQAAHVRLASLELWTHDQLEAELRALCEELGLKPGQLFGAIRVAVTGRTVAPPLFDTLAALGKARTLQRLEAAASALAAHTEANVQS